MSDVRIVRISADYTKDVSSILKTNSLSGHLAPSINLNLPGAETRSPQRLNIGAEYGVLGNLGTMALQATINSLESSGFATDLANPILTLSNGKKGSVSFTEEIPVPEQVLSGSTISTVTKFKPVESTLEVIPQARANGKIYLSLTAAVGASGPVGPLQIPSIITRRAEIEGVEIMEGNTLVVAGFTDLNTLAVQRKSPPISDIPFLGGLTKGEDIERSRTGTYFIVTPYYLKEEIKD